MVVVFDFDKTLTYRDTLFDFYRHCARSELFKPFKYLIYILAMLFHRYRLISNLQLKQFGIKLFLSQFHIVDIAKYSNQYSTKIMLNKIYHTELAKYNNPIILSASFIDYIAPLFKSAQVYGSEIEYDRKDRAVGIKFNCYGYSKCKVLKSLHIDTIDVLYTDSISDLPLARMAKTINLVFGDEIIRCNDLDHFKTLSA